MSNQKLRSAEIANGRLAMIGVAALGLIEFANNGDVLTHIQNLDIQSIWWSIGIYAV